MPRPYSEDLQWRAIWMASLGVRPHCIESHLAVQENICELYSVPV